MKTGICLALLFAMFPMAYGQKGASDLQTMVDTERAFARMSEEQGIRPSFMAFIAEDGILFRPKAVKGKQWMTEHPLPPSDKRPLLTWRPSFADMALAGDMGYTFGPWEYKDDVKDTAPNTFGHFVTVWKKQADGSWKFAVDLGVSHPESQEAELPARLPVQNYGGIGPKHNRDSLRATFIERERAFANSSMTRGARQAFYAYAAPRVSLFREGKKPLRDRDWAAGAITEATGVWNWQPEAWDVSASNDLAYSYGTYELKDNAGKVTETGNYFRIWKKQNGDWKVVVDLANPIPAK